MVDNIHLWSSFDTHWERCHDPHLLEHSETNEALQLSSHQSSSCWLFSGNIISLFVHISSAAPILVINIVVKIGVFLDTVGVTSSILSLALISLERMLAMLWPFRHRTVKTWYYHLSVGIVWLLACFNGVVNVIIDLYRTKSQDGFSYLMAITIICSVLVITGAYLAIWFSIKRSNRFRSNTCRSMEQDRKLAKTLFIVTAFSVFTCLPSGISVLLLETTSKICTHSGYKSLL